MKRVGELDIMSVSCVDERVEPVIGTLPERLVVDVSGLSLVDSSGIGLWVSWARWSWSVRSRPESPRCGCEGA